MQGMVVYEHPSQGLLDLFTLCTVLAPETPSTQLLTGKKIAIVGDILHSRVARSNLYSLQACGAQVPPRSAPNAVAHRVRSLWSNRSLELGTSFSWS